MIITTRSILQVQNKGGQEIFHKGGKILKSLPIYVENHPLLNNNPTVVSYRPHKAQET